MEGEERVRVGEVARGRGRGRDTILKRLSNLVSTFCFPSQRGERANIDLPRTSLSSTYYGSWKRWEGWCFSYSTCRSRDDQIKPTRSRCTCIFTSFLCPLSIPLSTDLLTLVGFVIDSLEKHSSSTRRQIHPTTLGLRHGAKVNRNLSLMRGVIVMTMLSRSDRSERKTCTAGRRGFWSFVVVVVRRHDNRMSNSGQYLQQ